MLITVISFSCLSAGLITLGGMLGSNNKFEAGYPFMLAALFLGAPGAAIFTLCTGVALLLFGQLPEIDNMTFTVFSCLISTLIYGFTGLWLSTFLIRKKTTRVTKNLL